MDLILAILSMASIVVLTFVFFMCLGISSEQLLVGKKTIIRWRSFLSEKVKVYITISNIFATITSLATVYVFFLGSAKIFGVFTFICCISIVFGGMVSNFFTNKLLKIDKISQRLNTEYPQSAVIAALFYDSDLESQRLANCVKFISMLSISAVIWLEFAIFGDIFGKIFTLTDTAYSGVIVGVFSFFILYFTTKYGLKGFVFADMLHGAIIGVAIIAIAIQVIYFLISGSHSISNVTISSLFSPLASPLDILIFSLHVLVGNAFFVLLAESHWMRLWLFEHREIEYQFKAQGLTAVLWGVLILSGLIAFQFSHVLETSLVADLLKKFWELPVPFLYSIFWIGAIAALFSTADGQLYCFFLVKAFDLKSGTIPEKTRRIKSPFFFSLVAGILFSFLYILVRKFNIPFEKLVFSIMPISMNILPAMLPLALGIKPKVLPVYISLVIYMIISVTGLLLPQTSLYASLGVALVPVVVSLFVCYNRRAEIHA